jgi:hypothetical protein
MSNGMGAAAPAVSALAGVGPAVGGGVGVGVGVGAASGANNNASVASTKIFDLSDKYVGGEQLDALRRSKSAGVENLVMQRSVLQEVDTNMAQLQTILHELSHSLKRINFQRTNVSGRIFYKGREFPVLDPESEHVTVETYQVLAAGSRLVHERTGVLLIVCCDDVHRAGRWQARGS